MKKVLYTGLDAPAPVAGIEYIHYPVIRTVPRSGEAPDIQSALQDWPRCTHVLFSSKTAVEYFSNHLQDSGQNLQNSPPKQYIVAGKATAGKLQQHGVFNAAIPKEETAEGMMAVLEAMHLEGAYILWPHSALSRPILRDFLQRKSICFVECVLYDTLPNRTEATPSLEGVEEIIFTSPSTVRAFLDIFGTFPANVYLRPIGPVTAAALEASGYLDYSV